MATVEEVFDVIDKIATQFEEQVVLCMVENKHTMVMAVCEQLYSGLDGDGDYLNPNYLNDPFFKEEGFWHSMEKCHYTAYVKFYAWIATAS